MAGNGGHGTVIVPWYATGFRGDAFEAALNEIAAVAPRYGASYYAVYRARDDRYRFQQLATFEDAFDWERYWEGPEMIDFRAQHSGWYQVPVLYGWWDKTTSGQIGNGVVIPRAATPATAGNGHVGNGGVHAV